MNNLIEQINQMRFEKKMSYQAIANELGCSASKVFYHITKHNSREKTKLNINEARDNKILQMRHVEKMSYHKIGEHFNISRERVRQILKKLNADGIVKKSMTQKFKHKSYYSHPSLRSDIFDVIDSQDKAYYLGILLQKLISYNEFNRINSLLVFRFTNTEFPMVKKVLDFLGANQNMIQYHESEFYPTLYIVDKHLSTIIYKYFDYQEGEEFFVPNKFIKHFFAGIIYYSSTFISNKDSKTVYKIDFSFKNASIISYIFKQIYEQTCFDLRNNKGSCGPKTNKYQIQKHIKYWMPFIKWIPDSERIFPNVPEHYKSR